MKKLYKRPLASSNLFYNIYIDGNVIFSTRPSLQRLVQYSQSGGCDKYMYPSFCLYTVWPARLWLITLFITVLLKLSFFFQEMLQYEEMKKKYSLDE